ncbi:hypothetical protein AB0N14_27270 [Streptomyces sp. NPDC051104]|uniref:hypothetical protein n=1 Tax=Streptomyces sp. NPDC051104 TaxID=3155044 RepID=UPI0034366829
MSDTHDVQGRCPARQFQAEHGGLDVAGAFRDVGLGLLVTTLTRLSHYSSP